MGPNVINFSCDLTPIIKPYSSSFMPGDYTQLLDEVFVISRIINVEVGVISRSRRLRLITLTESTLIILDITKTESNNCFIIHWTNPFFLASTWRVFSLCQLFLFLRFSQFFLFHIISKQLLCHLRRPVLFLWVLVFNYFFDVLLGQRLGSKPGSLVPFSSDEALQIGGLLSLLYIVVTICLLIG